MPLNTRFCLYHATKNRSHIRTCTPSSRAGRKFLRRGFRKRSQSHHRYTHIIGTQLTDDFWRFSVPQDLITSGAAISPSYQCYLAALNILDAQMFKLNERVRDWMDPNQPARKGTGGHHLFPVNTKKKCWGFRIPSLLTKPRTFAPTDWSTNIHIAERAPHDY
ncbi:TPA: hypothetical protein NBQ01_001516 [Corynebacterium striatum]|nr:hypothetical protein [Corynebacterium striatum]